MMAKSKKIGFRLPLSIIEELISTYGIDNYKEVLKQKIINNQTQVIQPVSLGLDTKFFIYIYKVISNQMNDLAHQLNTQDKAGLIRLDTCLHISKQIFWQKLHVTSNLIDDYQSRYCPPTPIPVYAEETQTVGFRVPIEVATRIHDQAKKAHVDMTKFIIMAAIKDLPIIVARQKFSDERRKLIYLVNKTQNNLDQISRCFRKAMRMGIMNEAQYQEAANNILNLSNTLVEVSRYAD